jgi:hypothetical protein
VTGLESGSRAPGGPPDAPCDLLEGHGACNVPLRQATDDRVMRELKRLELQIARMRT